MRNQRGNIILDVLVLFILIFTLVIVWKPATTRAVLHNLNVANLIPSSPSYPPPSADIIDLANQASMTQKAKDIFYAARPEIDYDRATFDNNCQSTVSSKYVELGCFTPDNRIFLLGISEPDLKSEMVVTAAHEMLHAAYAKLSGSDESTVNSELESATTSLANQKLNDELTEYNLTEPGERDNELHSILGTEYPSLGPDLEQYYSQYFTDRQTVVADHQQFEDTFSNLKTHIDQLENQIKSLKRELNISGREGDISDYNSEVAQINSLIDQYNLEVDRYNQLSRSLISPEQAQTSP